MGDGPPQVLAPVENPACQEQSGTTIGQACLATIHVHPSLGSVVTRQDPAIITNTGPLLVDLELPTRTDYDLDLIDQRARLEGTLNFVLPPELTAAAAGGLTLRAQVQPVGRAEAAAGDNRVRAAARPVHTAQPIEPWPGAGRGRSQRRSNLRHLARPARGNARAHAV